MVENNDTIERIIDALKEPVRIDPALDARVMAAIEALPTEQIAEQQTPLNWLFRRWTFRLSPIGGLAIAAGLAGLVLVAGRLGSSDSITAPAGNAGVEATANPATGGSEHSTQFVLVAPEARSVTLVGDFNDWSFSATPLAQQPGDGVWWVTVQLEPGRYRYAFVVDGTTWREDPLAPAAEDEFGRPNSVVTIGGA